MGRNNSTSSAGLVVPRCPNTTRGCDCGARAVREGPALGDRHGGRRRPSGRSYWLARGSQPVVVEVRTCRPSRGGRATTRGTHRSRALRTVCHRGGGAASCLHNFRGCCPTRIGCRTCLLENSLQWPRDAAHGKGCCSIRIYLESARSSIDGSSTPSDSRRARNDFTAAVLPALAALSQNLSASSYSPRRSSSTPTPYIDAGCPPSAPFRHHCSA